MHHQSISRAMVWILLLSALLWVGCIAVWTWATGKDLAMGMVIEWPWIGIFVVGVVVHEALHGLGFRLGGAAWRDIRFGIGAWLSPYAHCQAFLPARGYRLATVLPGLALGIVPVLAGLALGNEPVMVLGGWMLICAAGDFYALWLTRGVDGTVLVQDHPSQLGVVLEEARAS